MPTLEMRDRVLMIPTLENRMEFMQKEIQEAKNEVINLLGKYERESRDVERLQKNSFSAFLFKLVGRYEDKLEKEQREEINAKIDYDRAVTHHESLKSEKYDLAKQIFELKTEEQKLHTEIDRRRQEISGKLSEEKGIQLSRIETERKTIMAKIAEIEAAFRATSRVRFTANRIADSLSSAKGWATFDAFTRGGIITHMAKYSHIDEAEAAFNTLSHDLRELQVELGDVEGLSVSGLTEISASQRTFDFWFDNIFTDLSIRSQISDNEAEIDWLIRKIDSIESSLHDKRIERERELEANKKREEELLLSING
jgi:hypothetical protein